MAAAFSLPTRCQPGTDFCQAGDAITQCLLRPLSNGSAHKLRGTPQRSNHTQTMLGGQQEHNPPITFLNNRSISFKTYAPGSFMPCWAVDR